MDLFDYSRATVTKPTLDYFEQLLVEQLVHSADYHAMTTMIEQVKVDNDELKKIVSQQ